MPADPKTNEWNLLKDQFDALVHDEPVYDDSIEKFLDEQIRRRFGEFINRAVERKTKTDSDARQRASHRIGHLNGAAAMAAVAGDISRRRRAPKK